MSWIKTIPYTEADNRLKKIYDRVKGPDNHIDNVLTIHSLRPHTLVGHMTLYKSVLHNNQNTLPKWYLEAIGVYVSFLNSCEYCVAHHAEGLKRLLPEHKNFEDFYESVKDHTLDRFFDAKFAAGINYAQALTLKPEKILEQDIDLLRSHKFTEGEILEVNQVTSYFNYVNRMVLGLGVTTRGDVLGKSPNNSDDPENWQHA